MVRCSHPTAGVESTPLLRTADNGHWLWQSQNRPQTRPSVACGMHGGARPLLWLWRHAVREALGVWCNELGHPCTTPGPGKGPFSRRNRLTPSGVYAQWCIKRLQERASVEADIMYVCTPYTHRTGPIPVQMTRGQQYPLAALATSQTT